LRIVALSVFLNLLVMLAASGFDQTYWVWQRTNPLRPEEARDLRSAGITGLDWHVGTVKWDGTAWRWHERIGVDWPAIRASCPGVVVTPVVRIEAGAIETFPPPSRAPLIDLLKQLVVTSGANSLQIDYESPDRLIGEYADFLRELKHHGRNWRLSISALGHWSRFTRELAGGADEITPMFYDLNPDLERLGREGLPPLIEPDMATQLAAWRDCPIPWRAGLPNFSRVTVVNADGKSRGNMRNWSWDAIYFAPFLQPLGPTVGGQTVLEVNRNCVLGYTPVKSQEHLAIRYPDRAQLRQAQIESAAAGARGVIYFRLADSSDPSGYSVRDLGGAKPEEPSFEVAKDTAGRFVLTNRGTSDLMPVVRGTGETDRGYALEFEAQTPVWREAIPGDFAKVTSGGEATGAGLGVAHLQFWFTHLAAGNSLRTGYIGEAAQEHVRIRWRVRNLEKEDAWHSLD
jgi:hypothetical protein